ncbi:integrating conjugative element protein, PFL_4703 family [Legionella beliardensis]|uniref:Integrating conjugative element protein, PFL_4703 family n=1 Tax=Legionella beliardensis TaxID=91822 RepID=A0A378JXI8_9GAMM|nr:DUF2895 family protein [Legionella beliardensis]STX55450.1 integrating conjugative element protein, PFL_4703 family [Legionella beliardensis]STX55522.1 integrating conjugative element protein, PFL_4703 family [Legionella beliardensis]
MFNYYKKIDSLNELNRLLLVCCGAFFLLTLWLGWALMRAPSQLQIWLTPAMSANGGLIKADDIPDEYVHGFVATLIPALNSWPAGGEEGVNQRILAYQHYFTPRFRDVMVANQEALNKAGLFSRTQLASLYRFLEPNDVKRLSHNVWEVHVVLRLTQKLNDQSAMVIADKVVDYYYRVVKVNVSKLQNPFGLALDGYSQPERLVSDLLSSEVKGESHS